MTPILASIVTPVDYMPSLIKSLPSLGYELSLGTSLAKVSHDGCIVFYV